MRKSRIKVNCVNCTKEVEIFPSRFHKNNFCSPECYHSYRKGKPNVLSERALLERTERFEKLWSDPEYKKSVGQKISKSIIEKWKDVVYRNKVVDGLKVPKGPYNLSIEEREKRSSRLKELNRKRKGISHTGDHNRKSGLGVKKYCETKEAKLKKSESTKKQWENPEVRKQRCESISISTKRRMEDPEVRRHLSESTSKRLLEGKGYYTKHFYSKKNDKLLYYQSTWELASFEILEQLDKVKSYDRCRFYIEYEFEGKKHRYIPDIIATYQDGSQQIIEVKPKFGLTLGKNVAKLKALNEFCLEKGVGSSVWTEDEIFS